MYNIYLKRCLDLFLCIILFIPIFILITLTYVLVWINMGRPCLFKQARPGLKNKIFSVYKFRTMSNVRDNSGELLADALRLTRLGKLLRALSLDELPQWYNVFKGEMSWVGPRPLLVEYLPHYTEQQSKRHHVRPGITGWAQVKGRNALSWEQKINLDVWYAEHVSFIVDLKIIFYTILVILSKKGINAKGHATMPKFTDHIKKEK